MSRVHISKLQLNSNCTLIKGGETRVLAASMAMEQIFKISKEFKQEVFDKVKLELNQFGL